MKSKKKPLKTKKFGPSTNLSSNSKKLENDLLKTINVAKKKKSSSVNVVHKTTAVTASEIRESLGISNTEYKRVVRFIKRSSNIKVIAKGKLSGRKKTTGRT